FIADRDAVRRRNVIASPDHGHDRMWSCQHGPTPRGVATTGHRAALRINFSVAAIGREKMLIWAPASDVLRPGAQLVTSVSFPGVRQVPLLLEVLTVTSPPVGEDDVLTLCRICDPGATVLAVIGQYLLESGPWATKAQLGAGGLPIRSLASAVEIGVAATDKEKRQAFELRQLAYAAAGKVAVGRTMAAGDDHDREAIIVIARHKGTVIASLRLMYHGPGEAFEHEAYTELPADLDRSRTTEITRLCTHPEFRGSDLLAALLQFSALAVIAAGRPIVLSSATKKLLPLYERLGMRSTGNSYIHSDLADLEHWLITGDARQVLPGRGIGPLAWNVMWAQTWDRAVQTGVVRPQVRERTRTTTYRGLGPLARSLALRSASKRRVAPQ
ncbi:MAG TPA: GNAT family N-acyltransferase, partial [Chloroflexota bacterium]